MSVLGLGCEENCGADVEQSAQDLSEIEAAAAQITIVGARYSEELNRLTGL